MTAGTWAQLRQSWPHYLNFKSRHLPPVRGGRWSVRRNPYTGKWRAWTRGKASRWNKSFDTQQEAIAWAHLVAWAYTYVGQWNADVLLRCTFSRKK